MNYRHALCTDAETLLIFHPSRPKGTLGVPVLDKTATCSPPDWLTHLPVIGFRDGGVDIDSVLTLALHLVFDKDGDTIRLSPALVRYLCMVYMVAHDIPCESSVNYIPYTLYCHPLHAQTRVPINEKIMGVLVNTINACKSIHHRGDDTDEHPHAQMVFGANVCVPCYEKTFEYTGLSTEEVRASMDSRVFEMLIVPLLRPKMRQFLVGLVVRQFMNAFGVDNTETITTLGETYLNNTESFMGMYFKNTSAFRVLMQLTDAYHWALYTRACAIFYKPAFKYQRSLVYFGWFETSDKLPDVIYGDGKYTKVFEDAPRTSIYQSIYIQNKSNHKKYRIVMETMCYRAWQKISQLRENRVCIYPIADDFVPAVVTLDVSELSWPSDYTWPKEIHVINSDMLTWTNLVQLLDSGKNIYLYGNLEKAHMGVGDIGGVFCVLVETFRLSQPSSPVVVESDAIADHVDSKGRSKVHDYLVSEKEWPLRQCAAWKSREFAWKDIYRSFRS